MNWNKDAVAEFFGCVPDLCKTEDGKRYYFFDYSAQLLKYQLIVGVDTKLVSISGDTERPFGAFSIYEFNVPSDAIQAGIMTTRFEGSSEQYLSFTYGSGEQNLRMMIIKRPDGELIVWPTLPLPQDHPDFQEPPLTSKS
ncbi:MAG: hypothetical protein ACO1QB_07285 [Verrucomicrobiales bacterium]